MSPTYSVCKEHGYITGEQYICPKCGARTEVYSRITGYYRPIQNWNDGKSEEFLNRKTYNIKTSKLTHGIDKAEETCDEAVKTLNETLLFGTKTCPNCKMAKMLLEKAGVPYKWVDAEENVELTNTYNVRKAPTLLVPNGDEILTFENASNIKGYIESLK
jgi:ribonucleoside-triphosphate reductase